MKLVNCLRVSVVTLLLLVSCNASPPISVNKNIYVIINGEDGKAGSAFTNPVSVEITYTTTSTSAADVTADQEGTLKLPAR